MVADGATSFFKKINLIDDDAWHISAVTVYLIKMSIQEQWRFNLK